MSITAAVGRSREFDAHEAGAQAVRQALEKVGQRPVKFGWVIAGPKYKIQHVIAGVAGLLGDSPLFGFSSSGEFMLGGYGGDEVVVALLAGEGVRARADWWPGFGEDSRRCVSKMLKALQPAENPDATVLLAADGLLGDAANLCSALPGGSYSLAGCLAGGSLWAGRTFQIGGRQSGSGGLAAALLSGELRIGMGYGHGWLPVGSFSRLTGVEGVWVRELDDKRPNETYARLFGNPARDWLFPPLNQLVRLYPLGVDLDGELQVRSALLMEADGSLRMNTSLAEGKSAYLMVGSVDACLEAARFAARQALDAIGTARPVLGIVLVDASWRMLFKSRPGQAFMAVQDVLGSDIPLAGGYTFGQIVRSQVEAPPFAKLLNQHLEVIIFAEPDDE